MVERSQGRQKSNFPALANIPDNATLDFVSGQTNFKITQSPTENNIFVFTTYIILLGFIGSGGILLLKKSRKLKK